MNGKHLICFQNENAVFKFVGRSADSPKPFVMRILTLNIKDDYAKSEMIKRNSKMTADFLLFLILQRSVDGKY